MQNQLIKCCIVALFTSLVSIPSQAQTSTSARSAGDDLSGWVHVEVAVMIDTDIVAQNGAEVAFPTHTIHQVRPEPEPSGSAT